MDDQERIEVEGTISGGEVEGPATPNEAPGEPVDAQEPSQQEPGAPARQKHIRRILWVVLMAAAVAIYLFTRLGGGVSVKLDDSALTIGYPQGSYTLEIRNMQSVQLVSSPSLGTLVSGKQDRNAIYGWAENSTWGQYRLVASPSATKVVCIGTTEGYVVLSASSDEKTAALFRELLPLVQSSGA